MSPVASQSRTTPGTGCALRVPRKDLADSCPGSRHAAVLCAIFAVFASAAAAQSDGPTMHEVPLLSCSGLPCVELTSSSVNVVRLVIDLASLNAYLDIKAANNRGLKLQPLKSASGSDITDVEQIIIPGAKLGDLQLGDLPFMVMDLTADTRQAGKKKDTWFPADGALSFGCFKNRRIQMDWNKHVLRVSEPMNETLACPRDCGTLARQHFGQYGPETLTATGFEIEGHPVVAQIDTLFTGSMLVYPASFEKLQLHDIDKSKHKQEFPFTQGGLRLTQGLGVNYTYDRDPLLNEAPVYFWAAKEETAPSVKFDATVGTDLLSRALFTFDFKANRIWMSPFSEQ